MLIRFSPLRRWALWFAYLAIAGLTTACVDPADPAFDATVNVVVVDGTITNLAEPQLIRLNRAKADPLTGRFGTTPLTKAQVEVVVDSSAVVAAHETEDGTYQLPSDFRGRVGHTYQLRFTLADGSRYVSTAQTMAPVAPIGSVTSRFNPASLPPALQLAGGYRAGHDIFVDFQDPASERNYYRWEWKLWEKQSWCRSCRQGVYAVNAIVPRAYKDNRYYVSGTDPYEACFVPVNYRDPGQPRFYDALYTYDYPCRTDCWEILYSYAINVFSDQFSNGGQISRRPVAQIPYYDSTACLVEVRQSSLTPSAYGYFRQFQDQTQNTGGLADTPPSAPVGNIQNVANRQERVVGYFTASAVSAVRRFLDRKDAVGLPFGQTDPTGPSVLPGSELFFALNNRQPTPEPQEPRPNVEIYGGPPRPPTAICVPSNSRTPFKPDGWRD